MVPNLKTQVLRRIALACLKWVRWFAGLSLAVLSVVPVGLGVGTAFGSDWNPSRPISSVELQRAGLARDFVEAYAKRVGRLPTHEEFLGWKVDASSGVRLSGQVVDYRVDQEEISFSWWDGDANVTWYPGRDKRTVLIPPKFVFLFDSKLMDLSFFFGSAALMLLIAYWLMPWRAATPAFARRWRQGWRAG